MKVITKFSELDNLPLSECVKSQLKRHMTEPFEFDEKVTADFWEEISTSLILIEESDTDETIGEQSESVQHLIRFAQNYPESVYILPSEASDFIIALAIITSCGGGVYLASSITNQTQPIQILLPQAETIN